MDVPTPPQNDQPQAQPHSTGDVEATTLFAQTNFRNENRKFGIRLDDRRRHMYVIGKTGMGKSTLLENMIIQDIQAGKGLAVVDPHGDLVEKVVKFIPNNRINDVIYLNPADLDFPIAFNILESVDPQYKNLVSNGLVGVFKKIWADSWGPRLEYILTNTILALLDYPGSTLLGVTRMLVDGAYRKRVMRQIEDPVVKSFWVNEFNNYSEKFRNEAIAPIQNKVGQFLSSQLIRNIVGQSRSTIDMREIMDSRKILLMNLSKGRIGEENAALLGAMMITKIQLAAMSRVDIPEPERKDFYLYVDEFQNFSTESFAGILSEARKYRLNIIMAHQYVEQLSDEVKAAVFGNVGTMVVFRVGATDAEEFEKEFEPVFMKDDIVSLPAYQVYLRLMIDGVASEPFSAATLPPISGETENRDKVIRVSRERYSRPRAEVEERILKWSDPTNTIEMDSGETTEEKNKSDAAKKKDEKAATDSKKPAPKKAEEQAASPGPVAEPSSQAKTQATVSQVQTPTHSAAPVTVMPQLSTPQIDELDEFKIKHINFVSAAAEELGLPIVSEKVVTEMKQEHDTTDIKQTPQKTQQKTPHPQSPLDSSPQFTQTEKVLADAPIKSRQPQSAPMGSRAQSQPRPQIQARPPVRTQEKPTPSSSSPHIQMRQQSADIASQNDQSAAGTKKRRRRKKPGSGSGPSSGSEGAGGGQQKTIQPTRPQQISAQPKPVIQPVPNSADPSTQKPFVRPPDIPKRAPTQPKPQLPNQQSSPKPNAPQRQQETQNTTPSSKTIPAPAQPLRPGQPVQLDLD